VTDDERSDEEARHQRAAELREEIDDLVDEDATETPPPVRKESLREAIHRRMREERAKDNKGGSPL
jgi:hypothetical protein